MSEEEVGPDGHRVGTKATEAGYAFVKSMIPRADSKANLMWHGWALREAFVAFMAECGRRSVARGRQVDE